MSPARAGSQGAAGRGAVRGLNAAGNWGRMTPSISRAGAGRRFRLRAEPCAPISSSPEGVRLPAHPGQVAKPEASWCWHQMPLALLCILAKRHSPRSLDGLSSRTLPPRASALPCASIFLSRGMPFNEPRRFSFPGAAHTRKQGHDGVALPMAAEVGCGGRI